MRPSAGVGPAGWACLVVIVAVALGFVGVSINYADDLPNRFNFTGRSGRRTTTWSSSTVLFAMALLAIVVPAVLWYLRLFSHILGPPHRSTFGSLAGYTAGYGTFAVTFIVNYGAEASARAHDGLLAIAFGCVVGVSVFVIEGRTPRRPACGADEPDVA